MDPMERANELFKVFKSCVEHGPKFGGLAATAMRELKAINDEATEAEAQKVEEERKEAITVAERERLEREEEFERRRVEDEKVSGRPLVRPVDPALVQPRQMTAEEIEELRRKEREKLKAPQPHQTMPAQPTVGQPRPPYPNPSEEERGRRELQRQRDLQHPQPNQSLPARSPHLENEHNENPRRV